MEELKLYRYLSGEATDDEVQHIFDWLQYSPDNRKELIRLKQTWALAALADEDEKKAWNELKGLTVGVSKKKTFWFSYLKYAAVVIFLIGLGAISQRLFNDTTPENIYLANTVFEVPIGEMSSVILPDGTLVYLNSESTLSYSNNFSSGNRVVELSGEGYFNVQTDIKHPFIVKTSGSVDVKVYGTAFNVRAYSDEEKIHTVLEEGSVSIIDKDGNELTKLLPGEKASYSKTENRLRVNKIRTELFSSWKDGMITFRNESLGEIARMMQRWYNVKIEFEDPLLATEVYNGTIMKNKPVDQILEVFRVTSSIEYEIIPQADKPTIIYWRKN